MRASEQYFRVTLFIMLCKVVRRQNNANVNVFIHLQKNKSQMLHICEEK